MKSFLAPLFLLLSLFACQNPSSSHLSIATAANMQYAMDKLVERFEEETGFECEIILGSSGKLTAQIMEGAPYDILVSADINYPRTVHEAGFAHQAPKVYALGKLVLWSMNEKFKPDIEALSNLEIKHIALANPKTAPYGKAAMEFIKNRGLEQHLADKLVYGESISQCNQFILSGSAEMGFTAKSVVLSPQLKDKGHWMSIDPAMYSPIEQAVVLLKSSPEKMNMAVKFYEFLSSKTAKSILLDYGYDVP
ncbi:molybdate ABC transporter substrate-binding protein [Echinicola marina]|uniref:molybdate ABC transporter substrate-binding protein n=1 Tax=Echinicola marina TaxID=2859768 RepID=UPI001CF6FC03|nr:molybdate ABC transporter substrate-binding protein [Echinicola marina]UCS92383.1 molybdate ABC transporter substrate-binding protein [Echinicola marina]